MSTATILFPHQLFENNPAVEFGRPVYLVEEELFFNQYTFHKQKLFFHRVSMKFYADYLRQQDIDVTYIEAAETASDVRNLIPKLKEQGVGVLHYVEPADDWLSRRLHDAAEQAGIELKRHDSPMFLNTRKQVTEYFEDKDDYYHTDFYITQRKERDVLVDKNGKPIGGKWSFDPENRSKYPKDKEPPSIDWPEKNQFYEEARTYVQEHFADNYGELPKQIRYPITFEDTRSWLEQFFERRFNDFGDYQDAIVKEESFLNHALLTPMLNVGLITPQEVLDATLNYAEDHDIPLNTLEGFIRQILGWREYIRAVYELEGSYERTENFWEFDRPIPESFWEGSTGIEPVDDVIKRVQQTGYAHHIERLMVLGNFMLLCEFDPDEVYRWFMELFVDAYDWVMVPNVYGMSQFADGGLMATKPYISSSNYVCKMSNYSKTKGNWQPIWDGLFWRFMHRHRAYFEQNNRMNMLVSTLDRMGDDTLENHLKNAEYFLQKL